MTATRLYKARPYFSAKLAYRYGWSGLQGLHSYSSFAMDRDFYPDVTQALYGYSYWSGVYGPGTIKWVGSSGFYNCKPNSCHRTGSAIDVSAITFNTPGGYKVDCNADWRNPGTKRLQYLAIVAALRRFCSVVIFYEDLKANGQPSSVHHNHIHADRYGLSTPRAITTSAQKDTIIIQTFCNEFNGESLNVDGSWGSRTWAAYNRLLSACGMSCKSPTTNYWDMLAFFTHMLKCGLAGQQANYLSWPCQRVYLIEKALPWRDQA